MALNAGSWVQIDVTLTAKADYAWMWGLQTAVESIFISQAKDDIAQYLQHNMRIFRDMLAAGTVSLSRMVFPHSFKFCERVLWLNNDTSWQSVQPCHQLHQYAYQRITTK